jgi:hypothetical protein
MVYVYEVSARLLLYIFLFVYHKKNEMIMLYWNIGNIINSKSKWGNKFIENLAGI